MRIDVTDRDIARGMRGNPYGCPMALAIRRALPRDVCFAGTTLFVCFIRRGRRERGIPLPERCRTFGHAFDQGAPVAPFTFSLALRRKVA